MKRFFVASLNLGQIAIVIGLIIVAPFLFAFPAMAQDEAGGGASILELILAGVAGSLPGLILAGWAWFKAHAAQSAAEWDDWLVARVEQVARGVVEKAGPPPTPAP